MTDRLDQSLDQILAGRKTTGTRGRGRPVRATPGRKVTTAPVGGIQKKTKGNTKTTIHKATTNGIGGTGTGGIDSKILVSNLPRDVDEKQIQDYFSQSVGPVKKVYLQYGPTGASSGRATIIFYKAGGANKALEINNGVLVEGRPMKIEIVVDAQRTNLRDTRSKSLADRVTATKSGAAQPRSAALKKDKPIGRVTAGSTRGGKVVAAARGGAVKRGKNAGRPQKKTADQLDAEMTDYFNTGSEQASSGTAAGGNADAGMDEIL